MEAFFYAYNFLRYCDGLTFFKDLNCRLKFEIFLNPDASAISCIEISFLVSISLQACSMRNSFKN